MHLCYRIFNLKILLYKGYKYNCELQSMEFILIQMHHISLKNKITANSDIIFIIYFKQMGSKKQNSKVPKEASQDEPQSQLRMLWVII